MSLPLRLLATVALVSVATPFPSHAATPAEDVSQETRAAKPPGPTPAHQEMKKAVPAQKASAAEEDTQGGDEDDDNNDAPVAQGAAVKAGPKSRSYSPTATSSTSKLKVGATMDRKAMESLGPLTNPLKGSLGDDLWSGSNRSTVETYIPQLPNGTTLWSVQWLARKVLLTNGDVGQLHNDKSSDSGDLFTLRIEKLLEIGAYRDAVDLYTLLEGEPSHDRLAHAGVLALMEGGLPAQACLEARATHKDHAETKDSDAFWGQINAVCAFIQEESVKTLKDVQYGELAAKAPAPDIGSVPGSKVLTNLVTRTDYRQAVTSPDDLAVLTDVERAVLRGMGRFDYTRLKIKKIGDIPSPILMTMAGDPNMSPSTRMELNMEAAQRGLVTPDQLGDLYSDMAKAGDTDAGSLPSRYKVASYVDPDETPVEAAERRAAVISALEGYSGSGLPFALLPFASMVPDIDPAKLSAHAVRAGLTAMLIAEMTPPDNWSNAWMKADSGDSEKSRAKTLIYLANVLSENLPTNSKSFSVERIKGLMNDPKSKETLTILSVLGGLGRDNLIHKLVEPDVYEKDIDLTVPGDYVMPVGSELDQLRDAAKNDRLGETALLASVVLKDYTPGKTHPGVLRDVLKSLQTVGLKEEARHVAVAALLSLEQ